MDRLRLRELTAEEWLAPPSTPIWQTLLAGAILPAAVTGAVILGNYLARVSQEAKPREEQHLEHRVDSGPGHPRGRDVVRGRSRVHAYSS